MKQCAHTDCNYPVFSKGYCKVHQFLRTDKKSPMKKVKSTKEKRVKLAPIPKLIEKAQKVVNAYVRLRDVGKACISCNSDTADQAGHYISVRMSSFLRFDPRNIHLQCAGCNKWKYGSPITYRIELRKRIGDLELEKLERDFIENKMYKWTRSQLEDIISFYTEKIKELKAA